MKPTLQEEIGMSIQGIDYVNSLEVKDEQIYSPSDADVIMATKRQVKSIFDQHKNNIPDLAKQIERERILRQSRRCWIGVGIIAIILVTLFKMS